MNNDFFTPLFINSITFYLIGLFLAFYIVKTKLLTLPGNKKDNDFMIHTGIKILLFIFSLLFTTIFSNIYISPYLLVYFTPSFSDKLILISIVTIIAFFLSNFILNDILDKGKMLNSFLYKILLIISSFLFSSLLVDPYSFFSYLTIDQTNVLANLFFITFFSCIIFAILLQSLKLLMNNEREFDRTAFKTKYALGIFFILLIFSVFSFKVAFVMQFNTENQNISSEQFNQDGTKLGYYIPGQSNSYFISDVKTGSTTSYHISNNNLIYYYNSTLLFYLSSSVSNSSKSIHTLNLNSGEIHTITEIATSSEFYYSLGYISYYLPITFSYHTNSNQTYESMAAKNIITGKAVNTTIQIPDDFKNDQSYFNYQLNHGQLFFVSKDLTKMVFISNDRAPYFYTLTNNSESKIQYDPSNNYMAYIQYNNFNFIQSDSKNDIFYQYNNDIVYFDYTNKTVNYFGNTTQPTTISFVNTKEQKLITQTASVLKYKAGNITLDTYANYDKQSKEFSVMKFDETTNTTIKEEVLYSPLLPNIEAKLLLLLQIFSTFGTMITAIIVVTFAFSESVVSLNRIKQSKSKFFKKK